MAEICKHNVTTMHGSVEQNARQYQNGRAKILNKIVATNRNCICCTPPPFSTSHPFPWSAFSTVIVACHKWCC